MRSMQRTSIHTVQRRTRHILYEDSIDDDASKMTLAVEVQLATDFHVSLQVKEKQQQITQLLCRNSSSTQQVYNVWTLEVHLHSAICSRVP